MSYKSLAKKKKSTISSLSKEVSQHCFQDTPYIVSLGELSFQNRSLNLILANLLNGLHRLCRDFAERKNVRKEGAREGGGDCLFLGVRRFFFLFLSLRASLKIHFRLAMHAFFSQSLKKKISFL